MKEWKKRGREASSSQARAGARVDGDEGRLASGASAGQPGRRIRDACIAERSDSGATMRARASVPRARSRVSTAAQGSAEPRPAANEAVPAAPEPPAGSDGGCPGGQGEVGCEGAAP